MTDYLDWYDVTREQALDPKADMFTVYAAEKILAERAAWEFADKHPEMEIATVNPPFFVGPMAPEWAVPAPALSALSTNYFLYDLLRRSGPEQLSPATVDVRDVATALVLALSAPPTSKVGRKRFPLSGEWYGARAAADYLAEVRPDLKGRLSEAAKNAGPTRKNVLDTSRSEEVLGLKYTDWHKTVLDGVEYLLELEENWKSQGWVPPN